jgi:hypothetical protein
VDIEDALIAYTRGEMHEEEAILSLFAELVRTGWIDRMPAHYRSTAQGLIDDDWISEEGEILVFFVD